jgi:hypothetical protein
MRRVQHTHVRIGFADHKSLIRADIDNPFLLYYNSFFAILYIMVPSYLLIIE